MVRKKRNAPVNMLWEGHTALDIIYDRRNTKWGRLRLKEFLGVEFKLKRFTAKMNWRGLGSESSNLKGFLKSPKDYYGLKGWVPCCKNSEGTWCALFEKKKVATRRNYFKSGLYAESPFEEVYDWTLWTYDMKTKKEIFMFDVVDEYMSLSPTQKYELVMKLNVDKRLLELIKRRRRN